MSKNVSRIIYILLLVLAFILLIIFYPSPADGGVVDGASMETGAISNRNA